MKGFSKTKCKFSKMVFASLMFVMCNAATAGIIFEFKLDNINANSVNNFASGDTFTIEFVDDSNFGTGVTLADINSMSYDIASLGAPVSLLSPLEYLNIDNLFSFSSLGNNNWELSLEVGGGYSESAYLVYDHTSNISRMQLTQNEYSTYLFFRNANDEQVFYNDDQILNFTTSNTQSLVQDPTLQVPEPSTFAIFALGIMGLAARKFKRKA